MPIIIFVNMRNLVVEKGEWELAEVEVRELLTAHGYPGDEVPAVTGSALKGLGDGDDEYTEKTLQFARYLDAWISDPAK